jgi:hypothetical protein
MPQMDMDSHVGRTGISLAMITVINATSGARDKEWVKMSHKINSAPIWHGLVCAESQTKPLPALLLT